MRNAFRQMVIWRRRLSTISAFITNIRLPRRPLKQRPHWRRSSLSWATRIRQPCRPAMLARAEKLIAYRRPSEARTELTAAIPQLGGVQRELAEVRLGEVDLFAGNARVAFDYLSNLKVTDSEVDAERLYYLIKCARRQDKTADVKPFLTQLEQQHANSSWRMKALTDVADQARTQNDAQHWSFIALAPACLDEIQEQQHVIGGARTALTTRMLMRPATCSEVMYNSFLIRKTRPMHSIFLGDGMKRRATLDLAARHTSALATHFPNTYFGILGQDRLKLAAIKSAALPAELEAFLKSVDWTKRDQFPSFKPGPVALKRLNRAAIAATHGAERFRGR